MPTINRKPFRIKGKHADGFDAGAFYNSWSWRKLAKRHRALKPLCRVSLERGDVIVGECVDHMIAIIHGGSKTDTRNFQTLTRREHAVKTKQETHGAIYASVKNDDGDLIPVYPLQEI